MNTSSIGNLPERSGSGSETAAPYTLEILARLSGVSSEWILLYHERGLLRSTRGSAADAGFDDETLRRLRRLEVLREHGGMNVTGLSVVACLLDEIEELHTRLHHRG